jgi:flagellar basal-body rod modification protein FlgD
VPVTPISAAAQPVAANAVPRSASQTMDGSAYMKLFLASMQNQDPSQPMSSSEMMQSTATLSQMQMLSSLGTVMSGLTLSQNQATATSLIGKAVTYLDPASGASTTGKVSGVSMSGSSPTLIVNEQRVPLGTVTTVNN